MDFTHNQLVDMWVMHNPINPYTLKRLTFEDFLISLLGSSALPPRRCDNIEPLAAYLTKVMFQDNMLSLPDADKIIRHGDKVHPQLNGYQTVLPDDVLRAALGDDYVAHYSYKDWVDALESALKRAGCPEYAIVFGQKYRIGFEWPDGKGGNGVFINVQPETLALCKFRSHPAAAAAER